MQPSDSSVIHFVRSFTLLATLAIVPGIAIVWNLLPEYDIRRLEPMVEITYTEPEQASPVNADHPMAPPVDAVPANALPAVLTPVSAEPAKIAHAEPTPRDFTSLERRLKELGAAEYQLAKWGKQGSLFRFSCYVTPSGNYAYRKHFQSIGPDALTVMESVITDIERWHERHQTGRR